MQYKGRAKQGHQKPIAILYLMRVLLNWHSKRASKSKISYFKHRCFPVHQEIVRLQVP